MPGQQHHLTDVLLNTRQGVRAAICGDRIEPFVTQMRAQQVTMGRIIINNEHKLSRVLGDRQRFSPVGNVN